MYGKLVIDGNAVYEIDEACLLRKGTKKWAVKTAAREWDVH